MHPPLFFLNIAFAILVFLWFYMNFGIVFSISIKNVIGVLIQITLTLYVPLGSMDFFNNINSSDL